MKIVPIKQVEGPNKEVAEALNALANAAMYVKEGYTKIVIIQANEIDETESLIICRSEFEKSSEIIGLIEMGKYAYLNSMG